MRRSDRVVGLDAQQPAPQGAAAGAGGGAPPPPATHKLLFLTHAGLYKHPSLGPAEQAVIEMGKRTGFAVTTVEGYKYEADKLDFSFLTRDYLNQFDGIMMMTNGNLPFTQAQKEMLLDFVKSGKGFIGTHCSSLTFYDYPAFGEMLGGYFVRSLTNSAQRKVVVLKVEDQNAPRDAHARPELAGLGRVLHLRRSEGRLARTWTRCSRTRFRSPSRGSVTRCCSASTRNAPTSRARR